VELVSFEREVFNNATEWYFHFEQFKAFQNGIFFWMNLTSPFQLSHCYNNGTGRIAIEFFSGWAKQISVCDPKHAYEVTERYFRGEGGELYAKLRPTLNCFDKTDDQRRLDNAYDYEINGPDFENAIFQYVKKHSEDYVRIFGFLDLLFKQDQELAAGVVMGEFYHRVAITVPNLEVDF